MASSTPGTVPPDRVTPSTRHPPSPASFAAIARPMIPVAPTTTAVRVVDSFGMIRDPPLAASVTPAMRARDAIG